jgi:hypothetical protein
MNADLKHNKSYRKSAFISGQYAARTLPADIAVEVIGAGPRHPPNIQYYDVFSAAP